jgi:hypothetical protein
MLLPDMALVPLPLPLAGSTWPRKLLLITPHFGVTELRITGLLLIRR